MFFTNSKKSVSESRAAATPRVTIIAEGMRVVGNITCQSEVQLDGQVDGDIDCSSLIVGQGARIAGAVSSQIAHIHGELIGKVSADAVTITGTARVRGEIHQGTLQVEPGAEVEGQLVYRRPTQPPVALETSESGA